MIEGFLLASIRMAFAAARSRHFFEYFPVREITVFIILPLIDMIEDA